MHPEVIAAFINFLGTIIAAIIAFVSVIFSLKYKKQIKSYAKESFVRFLSQDENFKDILSKVKTISAYTVNSYEIYNKLNTILEQNPRMSIRKVTLLVRKKENETPNDIEILNRKIELWKRLVQENRIKELVIIAYDHDPDHYYTILGNRLLFCGLQGVKSSDELAEKVGESKNQIFRYIRLTLVPEILQMVDERQIAFRPAVEISYLTEGQQYTLLEAMEYNDATPSLAQAIKMKKFMQEGKLTNEVIQSIMQEEKPNQKEKPAFKDERITKLIPKSIPRGQETDFVVKALEFYNRHLQRSKDRER